MEKLTGFGTAYSIKPCEVAGNEITSFPRWSERVTVNAVRIDELTKHATAAGNHAFGEYYIKLVGGSEDDVITLTVAQAQMLIECLAPTSFTVTVRNPTSSSQVFNNVDFFSVEKDDGNNLRDTPDKMSIAIGYKSDIIPGISMATKFHLPFDSELVIFVKNSAAPAAYNIDVAIHTIQDRVIDLNPLSEDRLKIE